MKIKAIVTGASGMVGEGVLQECLLHPDVEEVLVVGRKTCGITHPKLKEIFLPDFFNPGPVKESLAGYDACFFCLGVSSVGISAEKYFSLTHTLTMNFAGILAELNPGMTFCYISGAGTDSSEKGRINWARVKGKTENDLMKLPFRKVFAFRPGFLQPAKDARNLKPLYRAIRYVAPVVHALMPKYITTLRELGLAMINSVLSGYDRQIIEIPDIIRLAENKP